MNGLTEDDKKWFEERLDRLATRLEAQLTEEFQKLTKEFEAAAAPWSGRPGGYPRPTVHGMDEASIFRAIAGWNDWMVKADEDYRRVLAELAELKLRLDRLDRLDGGPK